MESALAQKRRRLLSMKQKKPYVKPGIVFLDYKTGELFGTPEMIEEMEAFASQQENQTAYVSCPFEGITCFERSVLKRAGFI